LANPGKPNSVRHVTGNPFEGGQRDGSLRAIAGGITSGITYFPIVVGSSDPPGMAPNADMLPNFHGRRHAAPVSAPVVRKSRLVGIVTLLSTFAPI
jgi:hypothetical protein